MIKAVIFDMYETLITLHEAPLYFSAQMAEDMGISSDDFCKIWREKGDNQYQMKRLDEFEQLNTPSDLFDYIRSTSLG